MPTYIDARPKPSRPNVAKSEYMLWAATVAGEQFRRWLLYRATVRDLESLSDRQLADLGIDRADIRDVARRDAG